MKSWYKYLEEKRKNSELNKKISAYEYLLPYKDKDDIYISFTDMIKVGINPNPLSPSTPNGIYTFPLKEYWKMYNVEKEKSVGKNSPFGGDRKYIAVIQGKHTKGFIKDIYKNYKQNNLDNDIIKLKKMFETDFDLEKYKNEFFQNLSKGISSNEQWKHVKAFLVSINKPFYNKAKTSLEFIKIVEDQISKTDMLDRSEIRKLKLFLKKSKISKFFGSKDKIIDEMLDKINENNPFSILYELTKKISNDIFTFNTGSFKSGNILPQRWNNLLRRLGYTGFADKSAKGLIFELEPLQAVFLTTSEFKVIDQILNKDYI